MTDALMANCSDAVADPSVYQTIDYEAWSVEGYNIAVTLYDGLTENAVVPDAYLDAHLSTAQQQIVKGGYRLAYSINYMFTGTDLFFPENKGLSSHTMDELISIITE